MDRSSPIHEALRAVQRAMKTRRVALGMSQEVAAARAGIALGTLRRFERTGEISLRRLLALLQLYGMDRRIIPHFEDMSWWRLAEVRRAETRQKA